MGSVSDLHDIVMKITSVATALAVITGPFYWRQRGGRVLFAMSLMLGLFPIEFFLRPTISDTVRIPVFAITFVVVFFWMVVEARKVKGEQKSVGSSTLKYRVISPKRLNILVTGLNAVLAVVLFVLLRNPLAAFGTFLVVELGGLAAIRLTRRG